MRPFGIFVLAMLVLAGCDNNGGSTPASEMLPPLGFKGQAGLGKRLFTENCARCHGADARGTRQGPPLIHKIYEPSHHADLTFYRAVAQGVQPHHWQFGPMPPVPGVDPKQVAHIVAYIRTEQQQAGIF